MSDDCLDSQLASSVDTVGVNDASFVDEVFAPFSDDRRAASIEVGVSVIDGLENSNLDNPDMALAKSNRPEYKSGFDTVCYLYAEYATGDFPGREV